MRTISIINCRLHHLQAHTIELHFVITTNVDGQFEMAGFDTDRIFATQGDYCYFQPTSGAPKELYHNREWVERALPAIHNCRIPTELIPHTPEGNTRLEASIALYRKLGLKEIPLKNNAYERCDILMELFLENKDSDHQTKRTQKQVLNHKYSSKCLLY